MNTNWYSLTKEDIFDKLKTDESGLTSKEAKKRLEKYGTNTLPKKKKDSVLKIFLNEFKNPILILLLFAVIASLIGNGLTKSGVNHRLRKLREIMRDYLAENGNKK